jgi:hypothetical protein
LPPHGGHDLVAADFTKAADFLVVVSGFDHAEGKTAGLVEHAGIGDHRGDDGSNHGRGGGAGGCFGHKVLNWSDRAGIQDGELPAGRSEQHRHDDREFDLFFHV